MAKASQKTRQRALSRSVDSLFTHNKWRIWRFDDKNIALLHEDESIDRIRYYSTLGGALRGLVKQIGFCCDDLKDCVNQLSDLNKAIERAGI